MMSSKGSAPKLWASTPSLVHKCAVEYGQLITTCTCANLSNKYFFGQIHPYFGHVQNIKIRRCEFFWSYSNRFLVIKKDFCSY